MKRSQTVKVKLEGDLYHDWGAMIPCCGKVKHFNKSDFEAGNMWSCVHCGKLLLVVDQDGVAYYAGPPVFNCKQK